METIIISFNVFPTIFDSETEFQFNMNERLLVLFIAHCALHKDLRPVNYQNMLTMMKTGHTAEIPNIYQYPKDIIGQRLAPDKMYMFCAFYVTSSGIYKRYP